MKVYLITFITSNGSQGIERTSYLSLTLQCLREEGLQVVSVELE